MTTAHRPTWKAAVGKAQEGGWSAGGASSAMRSVLDAPSHTKLKLRADVDSLAMKKEYVLKESLKKLQQVEEKHAFKKSIGMRSLDSKVEEEGRLKLLKASADVDDAALRTKYDDADDGGDDDNSGGGWSDVDAGESEESDLNTSDSDEDSDDDSVDSDDEEAALQAELAKIRAEREKSKAKADAEAARDEASKMEEAALVGNPLLNDFSSAGASGSGKLKRRWNDDVVFRNQAKDEPDQTKKRFINDTVRNDFHKRFLNKFIR